MQTNGSPPKKRQLGGSIKATSLTHKHNKILTNLKSLQFKLRDNIRDKDKAPLLNEISCDSNIENSSSKLSPIESSKAELSSFVRLAVETIGDEKTKENLSVSFSLPSTTSSLQVVDTNPLERNQHKNYIPIPSTSTNKNGKILKPNSIISKSSGSSELCSEFPSTRTTINKDNNEISNISYVSGNETDSIENTISSCSISNNSSITVSNKNYQHYRDQYHQPTYYPYSYSRNINSSLGGSSNDDGGDSCTKFTTATTYSSSLASSNSHHLYNSSGIMGGNSKRHYRKHTWGTRERAGMSFLIVIAFFAVFGLIILTELFMIDDKNRGGTVMLRHGNINNRMIDSIQPDYDGPKYGDDYDQSLGFLPKSKIHDEVDPLRLKTNRLAWNEILESKLEQTLPHYPVGEIATDGIWKVVNGTRFKFFVYSAYYDRRMAHLVRVIGATKTRRPEKVFCRLWYIVRDPLNSNRTKYSSATLSARVKIIREHWNLKYSAVFVLCPIPRQDIPFAVSVVSRLRAPPGNILQLRNTNNDPDFSNRTYNQIPNKMAICVKPFHFNYDQALYLMEYLELNALLGVSHFTFYNHTIGPHATCVLQHYARGDIPMGNLTTTDYLDIDGLYESVSQDGGNLNVKSSSGSYDGNNASTISISFSSSNITQKPKRNIKILKTNNFVVPTVKILPWDLRMRSQTEIRTEGLFAALNDCLYRNMYRYRYLALVDVDEFLMPKNNDTLSDLLKWLNRKYNIAHVGSYSFQNAFFYLQFPDDTRLYETSHKNPSLRGALVTQRKTRRRLRLHPQKQRSKYIINPEAVLEAGNHFVWDFVPGKKTFNVPAESGILHHYRVCEFGGDDCVKVPSLLDRTTTKYTNRLIERVEKVYNYLKKSCKLDNIPPAPTRPPPTRKKILYIKADKTN